MLGQPAISLRDPATYAAVPRRHPVGRKPLGRERRLYGYLPPLLDDLFREEARQYANDNECLNHIFSAHFRAKGKIKETPSPSLGSSVQSGTVVCPSSPLPDNAAGSTPARPPGSLDDGALSDGPTRAPISSSQVERAALPHQVFDEEEKEPYVGTPWDELALSLVEQLGVEGFGEYLDLVYSVEEYAQVIALRALSRLDTETLREKLLPLCQAFTEEHHLQVIVVEKELSDLEREALLEEPDPWPSVAEFPQQPPDTVYVQEERTEPAPKEEKQEAAPPATPLTKRQRREKARDELREKCTVHQNGKATFIYGDYITRVKLLEAEEAEEDAKEGLPKKNYKRPLSAFDPGIKIPSPAQVKREAEQFAKELTRPPSKEEKRDRELEGERQELRRDGLSVKPKRPSG